MPMEDTVGHPRLLEFSCALTLIFSRLPGPLAILFIISDKCLGASVLISRLLLTNPVSSLEEVIPSGV